MKIRRQVLGDEHVKRPIDGATDFSGDFQELITRHAGVPAANTAFQVAKEELDRVVQEQVGQ